MPLRKHGVGDILPEEEDIKKESSVAEREQALAEVLEEQKQADTE